MNAFLLSYKQSFISLYAMLLVLTISLNGLYALRNIAIKKEISLSLYFQKQSILYALSTKDIALQCMRKLGIKECHSDKISYDNNFQAEYIINKIHTQDTLQHATTDMLLLDISVYANTALSTHPLQYTRRFMLREKT